MTDRIPCSACGAEILPSTAAKTGGMCMPCKGGYRRNIESSMRGREEEKQYRASPAWKHWCSLVERVHKTAGGFDGLSLEEQRFFAVRVLVGEVYNGGFNQYFSNSSADYLARTVEGLMELGATESLRLLIEAKELLFGASPVPPTKAARNAALPCVEDSPPRLEEIDREFWRDPDRLDERVEKFASEHNLRRDF